MKPSIAIVIRGQVREWKNAKHSIFHLARLLSEKFEVVFFFVTWNHSYLPTYHHNIIKSAKRYDEREITEIELNEITQDFGSYSLGGFHVLDYQKVKETTIKNLKLFEEYEFITYIRYYANLVKQQYESKNEMVFHSVLELRPDLYIIPSGQNKINELALSKLPSFAVDAFSPTLLRTQDLSFSPSSPQFNCLFTEDLVIYSDSYTSDLINSEFHYLKRNKYLELLSLLSPHHLFSEHMQTVRLINTNNLGKIVADASIIRPRSFFLSAVDFTELSADVLVKIKIANGIFQNTKERLANNEP